jgi:hypothetical protein
MGGFAILYVSSRYKLSSSEVIKDIVHPTKISIPMENQNNTPSPEELQVEQESLAEVQDADLRSSVLDSLGLEADDNNEDLVNKLVEREKSSRQKLSSAIGAKIKYRTELEKFNQKPEQKEPEQSKTEFDADSIRKQTEQTVKAQFDEEYLEESEYSDELKAELRKVAKLNETTVRAATKDSYIQYLIEKETDGKRISEAAKNGGGSAKSSKGNSGEMPDQFTDSAYMATPEGQKAYDEWAKN